MVHSINKVLTLNQWHRTLGHCNLSDIKQLPKVVEGMKISNTEEPFCDTCQKGKMTHTSNGRGERVRATQPLELVHTDLAGPISPSLQKGYKYAICFVDNYSGMVFHYFLKHKDEASCPEAVSSRHS